MNCEATQEKFTLPITSLLFRNLVWFGVDAHRVNALTPGFQSGGAQVRALSQVQWEQDAPWEMLLRCGTLIDPKCPPLDPAPRGQEGSPPCSLLHPPSLQECTMPTVCRREGGKEEEGRREGGNRLC